MAATVSLERSFARSTPAISAPRAPATGCTRIDVMRSLYGPRRRPSRRTSTQLGDGDWRHQSISRSKNRTRDMGGARLDTLELARYPSLSCTRRARDPVKPRLPSSSYISVSATPDVRHAILTRRTFRTFERRPVPAELRASLLDAARWAPSPDDADCVRYVVIDDSPLKKRLFALTRESKD